MRVSFALAWGLRFPFLLVFLSSVLSLRPWRSRRRRASGGYVPDACPRSHHLINHLVRRGRSFLSSSCSASSHRCPLFSSGAVIVRRTESVASHQSLRLVLIELGKRRRMGFFAHRHLMSSGFSFLVSSRPSRVASRALFVIVMVARGVVSCGPTRFCLVGERRSVLRLSCGVAACLPSSFAYRLVLLLVVSSRLAVSSLVSFVISLFANYAMSWRLVFSSRGGRGGFGFSFYPDGERRGCGSRPAVSVAVLACLGAVGEWGDVVLVIGVPACFLSSYGCGAWGLCGVIIWFVVACFLFPGLSLLPRAAHSI